MFGRLLLMFASGWLILLGNEYYSALFAQSFMGVWQSPIGHTMYLSGSFGELRPNHFHGGIDIKSAFGRVGDPIYCVQDGYVSRILIDMRGYGNAVFINHPTGFTTVYAHLDKFSPDIAQYIWVKQKEVQCYILDYELGPDELPVKMGQMIGAMGNTGYSFGPHLHFEVMRTENMMLINPLLLGYEIKDRQAPLLRKIRVHSLDECFHQLKGENFNLKMTAGIYKPVRDTLLAKSSKTALSVDAIDLMDDIQNKIGVYRLELFLDERLIYVYQMDSFPKPLTRYLNAHCDFGQFRNHGHFFHRLHRLPGNKVDLYPYTLNDGFIDLEPGQVVQIKIAAYDFHRNMAVSHFYLKRDTAYIPATSADENGLYLACEIPHILQTDSLRLELGDRLFFEDTYFKMQVKSSKNPHLVSKVYALHHSTYPLAGSFILSIIPELSDIHLRDKACVVQYEGNQLVSYGGFWSEDFVRTELKKWGSYAVAIDTIPPKIDIISYKPQAKNLKVFKFKVSDNISPGTIETKLKIKATVNGQWVRGEYDRRSEVLTLYLDDLMGENLELAIEAADYLGNSSLRTFTFTR